MKTNLSIWIVGVLAGILSNECRANLNGSDNFDDNIKDATRWGTDFINGAGFITETNGRLEYTASGSPVDRAGRPWALNFGSYTENWGVRVDVNVPQQTLTPSQFVGIGVSVFPGTNVAAVRTNRFVVGLNQDGGNHEFDCSVAVNSTQEAHIGKMATAAVSAAVLVAFDASTKTLYAYYDEDGSVGGYSWLLLGSTNIAAGWNMTSTSVFTVGVVGSSFSLPVDSTKNVFADNFQVFSGQTPSLGINLLSSKVVLSWSTNPPSCHLERASTLTPSVWWQVVTNAPGIVGTNFTVTNTVSSDKAFYRLSR